MTIQSACRAFLLMLAVIAPPRLAAAEDVPSALAAPDQQAIRQVIEAQLDAFQHDDGAKAFGFASPWRACMKAFSTSLIRV